MLLRYTHDEREQLRKLDEGIEKCIDVLKETNPNDATPNLNKRLAYKLLQKQLNERKRIIMEHKKKAKAQRKRFLYNLITFLRFWR